MCRKIDSSVCEEWMWKVASPTYQIVIKVLKHSVTDYQEDIKYEADTFILILPLQKVNSVFIFGGEK